MRDRDEAPLKDDTFLTFLHLTYQSSNQPTYHIND